MNLKNKMGLVALCLLAAMAMTPSASAMVSATEVTVCIAEEQACGPNQDALGTVTYDVLGMSGCVTTNYNNPNFPWQC